MVARATATATSKSVVAALLLALVAGGGSSAMGDRRAAAPDRSAQSTGPFGWLRPVAAAAGWRVTRIPDGGTLAYPPSWRALPGDKGTASAALRTPDGRYLGYLNITPRQGGERERSWAAFRIRHNRAEGDTNVRLSASARGLRFRDGHGACVQDSYTTITRARYVEIACLVSGAGAANVIVGAAPPAAWRVQAPTIERAISAMTV